MPLQYRNSFDEAATYEHASIVDRRAGAPAHVEAWRSLPNGGAILCVVADDRPGLLSFVSASLAAAKMDVLSVQAYTRTRPQDRVVEAVDIVWLRHEGDASAPVDGEDISRVAAVLRGLVTGDLALESLLRPPASRAAASSSAVRVGFTDSLDAGHAVLVVETSDRPGLLLAVTLALFRARVQIVGSLADTKDGGATDRFTIAECDGARLSAERRSEVQIAVQAGVDALGGRAR
jgi:[protein-PII] uridylyltransferase